MKAFNFVNDLCEMYWSLLFIFQVHMVGLDIFTGKKYDDICPSTHNMQVPNVSRVEYEVTLNLAQVPLL